MRTGIFSSLFRTLGFLIALLMILAATAYWAVSSSGTIQQMIHHSSPADERAVQVEQVVLAHVKKSRSVTILYLNPGDIGDNFYRLRYALYPIKFVPYWSWTLPNQGGKVWTIPEFTTEKGLRKTMLSYHVNYVLAVSDPAILNFLHRTHSLNYLFRVNQHALVAGAPLSRSLTEVTTWRP